MESIETSDKKANAKGAWPHLTWEESEQVVIPGRYTKYGISEMVLQACYSAETPWVTGWLGNVARAGKFTGYAGSVNSSNMQELTKSFGGSGR